MGEEVTEFMINDLIEKNIPFVLFSESGKDAKILIQNSPLNMEGNVQIKERGFYVFPFSPNENSAPLFFYPDYLYEWKDFKNQKINFEQLQIPKIDHQKLYEVTEEEYAADIEKFFESFKKNNIKKTIYSRIRREVFSEELKLDQFFEKLVKSYPKAFVYTIHIPGDGIWVGASPELLLSYHNNEAKTIALAGTLKLNKNIPSPEWTRKEIDEQRLVEKFIIALCNEMEIKYEKSAVRSSNTGKVYHLKSDFVLNIQPSQIVEFLNKLHPTPAISGLPQKKSLELIYSTEKHERSYYGGFLGWVDNLQEFNLFINLRCMKLINNQCYFFAGGGITPESEISKEWAETNLKMSTLMDVLPLKSALPIQ